MNADAGSLVSFTTTSDKYQSIVGLSKGILPSAIRYCIAQNWVEGALNRVLVNTIGGVIHPLWNYSRNSRCQYPVNLARDERSRRADSLALWTWHAPLKILQARSYPSRNIFLSLKRRTNLSWLTDQGPPQVSSWSCFVFRHKDTLRPLGSSSWGWSFNIRESGRQSLAYMRSKELFSP